jgi:hypothetical protein
VSATRRAASAALAVVLTTLLTGCGGGFGSAPASSPDRTIEKYAALGDGFTAAPFSGDTADEASRRGADNYPALLAEELGVDQLRDVSCTGAATGALTSDFKPGKGKAAVPPQFDALEKDTDLVTMGIGIEDRDLLQHVFQICLALPCGDKVAPQTLLDDVNAMATALTTAVRAVQDRAPDAYIVLVSYPEITPEVGSCRALPKMEHPALDAANRVLDEINREIQSVARGTGADFLDVAQLSAGHDLCSRDPWVVSKSEQGGQPLYHPVAAEQRVVADALAELVRSH